MTRAFRFFPYRYNFQEGRVHDYVDGYIRVGMPSFVRDALFCIGVILLLLF